MLSDCSVHLQIGLWSNPSLSASVKQEDHGGGQRRRTIPERRARAVVGSVERTRSGSRQSMEGKPNRAKQNTVAAEWEKIFANHV